MHQPVVARRTGSTEAERACQRKTERCVRRVCVKRRFAAAGQLLVWVAHDDHQHSACSGDVNRHPSRQVRVLHFVKHDGANVPHGAPDGPAARAAAGDLLPEPAHEATEARRDHVEAANARVAQPMHHCQGFGALEVGVRLLVQQPHDVPHVGPGERPAFVGSVAWVDVAAARDRE